MSFAGRSAERAESSGESFFGAKPTLKLSIEQRQRRTGTRGAAVVGGALVNAFGVELEPFGAEHEAAFRHDAVADGETFYDGESARAFSAETHGPTDESVRVIRSE